MRKRKQLKQQPNLAIHFTAPLFTYVFDTCKEFGEKCNSLLGGLSIRGSILTLYGAATQMIRDQEFPDPSFSFLLGQLPGQIETSEPLIKGELLHDNAGLHPDTQKPALPTPPELIQNTVHSHHDFGKVIKPDMLANILNYIVQQQENFTLRKNLLNPKSLTLAMYQMVLSSLFPNAQFSLDTTTPFIKKEDMPRVVAAYTKYSKKHDTQVKQDYRNTQAAVEQWRLDQTWTDEAQILLKTAASFIAIGTAAGAGMTVLQKSLIANGIKENIVTWTLQAINLSFAAYYSSVSWYPLILSTTVLAVEKCIGYQDKLGQLGITANIAGIALSSNGPTPFGILNTCAATIAGVAGTLFGASTVTEITSQSTIPRSKLN